MEPRRYWALVDEGNLESDQCLEPPEQTGALPDAKW
jgi:hypothetical protein